MSQQIGKVFLDYRLFLDWSKGRRDNRREVIEANGEKPWIVLNDIISESKLPFKFNNPEGEKIGFRGGFQFKIMNNETSSNQW